MTLLDLLSDCAKKCSWLQPKFIHTHRVKSKFGTYIRKLYSITGNPNFFENPNFLYFNNVHSNYENKDHATLERMFMLWLSDISHFNGKRYFLKSLGGQGDIKEKGERLIKACRD